MDTRRSFGERSGVGGALLGRCRALWIGDLRTGLPPGAQEGGSKGAVAYPPHMHVLRGGHFWVSWLFPRWLLLLPALGSTGFGSR
jgi:hypothetical protein